MISAWRLLAAYVAGVALALAGVAGLMLEAYRSMALPSWRTAVSRVDNEPDDPGKIITLPPASVDSLIDQVKLAENRKAAAGARQAGELAALTAKHAEELEKLEAEHARAYDQLLAAIAARKLAVPRALLEKLEEPGTEP